ncbi:MAG: bifunctional 23S rRNA (guanine(2069)-N(7))-methyltransferase RlmK/23S rRNA (guanine(2445)-N(2))-methyltransferase RlmL [Proteobacteria bacterium]|nr:bifunctional 23S rRNA (guanine(2069)-N(7))-methyltransferase RlmK/23S rRNA (guanine(2445)-N(2))-methyltransferase RlmL [Pseudomonadota bacterium]
MSAARSWVATAPLGAASVLAEELAAFGAQDVKERSTDVRFQGPLAVGYRACLWSRTATRVMLWLGEVEAGSAQAVYQGMRSGARGDEHSGASGIDWREHLGPGATLACDCTGGNAAIQHTLYGAQLLKDAVCDALREATGLRPDVRPRRPDVRLHLHVEAQRAQLFVDLSGESLHRRGFRLESGRAPLKENLAAAILLRAGWPALAAAGASLVDPMCGSGTLLIEAAMIAADIAPGLAREYWGFTGWRGHDAALWQDLLADAQARRRAVSARRCIIGYDIDATAVRSALANAERAGVAEWLHVERRDIRAPQVAPAPTGLLVTNPPYGERVGETGSLPALYQQLGTLLRETYGGWHAAILCGNPPLARHLGVYAKRSYRFMNGAIDCRLLRFEPAGEAGPRTTGRSEPAANARGAQMFANRLRKNLQRLEPWARSQLIEAYRVYDADMPEYAFAIDVYGRDPRHLVVQEYAPPRSVDADKARGRRREVLSVLPQVFDVPLENIHSRTRRMQKGAAQYEAQGARGRRFLVHEGGLKFWVNFRDYLDTGLFLDHRLTRARIRQLAAGAAFLNLFCYTASATVYAAAGGARRTLGVDLSNTYLQWARDNLDLNGFGREQHELLATDCLAWLEREAAAGPAFDLIFLDPPTFSNSKRMSGVLDVQRDHVAMIRNAMRLLQPAGHLLFFTNFTRFKLDPRIGEAFEVEDISAATLPEDFARNPRIHRCYVVRHCG